MTLLSDIEGFFTNEEAAAQAALAPMLPWMKGIYVSVKKTAEAALKAAGSEVLTMATADFHSLLATVQSAVKTASADTNMSGAQKFELVAKSVMDGVAAGLYPTIKTLETAALNALINTAYMGLASGVLAGL